MTHHARPGLQSAAHAALTDTMTFTGAPAAALVAIDPRTGEVLAMDASTATAVASSTWPSDANRQAGSTFKTYTLLTAIGDGIDPYTTQ